MNREWYNIDVKKEVLNDVQNYLMGNVIALKILESLQGVSVRDMMDISFISKIEGINKPRAFIQYVSDRYMYYRSQKYGQEGFWESAANERNIGYSGLWYEYISKLLAMYCKAGDKVLFVGTADGREIPDNSLFEYYALEQIGNSVSHIEVSKVVDYYEADFEDDTFVISDGKAMQAIVALRCLMPNTRLNRFLRFVENNLNNQGVLIVSHPMRYLDANNEYKSLPNCKKTRKDFDERLKNELLNHHNMRIIYEEETNVEYFYIIKVEYMHESIID